MKIYIDENKKIANAVYEDIRLNPDNRLIVQKLVNGIWKDLLTEAASIKDAENYLANFVDYKGKLPEFDFKNKDYYYESENKIKVKDKDKNADPFNIEETINTGKQKAKAKRKEDEEVLKELDEQNKKIMENIPLLNRRRKK